MTLFSCHAFIGTVIILQIAMHANLLQHTGTLLPLLSFIQCYYELCVHKHTLPLERANPRSHKSYLISHLIVTVNTPSKNTVIRWHHSHTVAVNANNSFQCQCVYRVCIIKACLVICFGYWLSACFSHRLYEQSRILSDAVAFKFWFWSYRTISALLFRQRVW